MNDERVQTIVRIADELRDKPERWGWPITAILYGHSKVVVQCVSPRGTPVQFVGKVPNGFSENSYRSKECHICRADTDRAQVAQESDEKKRTVVQELVCDGCGERYSWWWFAKLPLTDDEKKAVVARGGKAW